MTEGGRGAVSRKTVGVVTGSGKKEYHRQNVEKG